MQVQGSLTAHFQLGICAYARHSDLQLSRNELSLIMVLTPLNSYDNFFVAQNLYHTASTKANI